MWCAGRYKPNQILRALSCEERPNLGKHFLKKIFISLCSLILDLVHQSTLQRNERSTLEWLGDLKVTTLLLMQSLIYCALHAMGATILN